MIKKSNALQTPLLQSDSIEKGNLVASHDSERSKKLFSQPTSGKLSRSGAFWIVSASDSAHPFWRNLAILFDHPLGLASMILSIVLVAIDGALWFMVSVKMIKFHDADKHQQWMNGTIHTLCGLFTYGCIYNFPQRYHNFLQMYNEEADEKRDMRHRFHWLTKSQRFYILLLLVLNCVFQYINQILRGVYYSYDLSNKFPGNLAVNAFFVLSFAAAAWAGAWQFIAERKIREEHAAYVRFTADRNIREAFDLATEPLDRATQPLIRTSEPFIRTTGPLNRAIEPPIRASEPFIRTTEPA